MKHNNMYVHGLLTIAAQWRYDMRHEMLTQRAFFALTPIKRAC